ncbi:MAG: hypothetical protein ACYDH6_23990 [Acidimicrobiales bacterium]
MRLIGVGTIGVLSAIGTLAPAHAAQTSTRSVATYSAAEHSDSMSCAPKSLTPSCAASSSADRQTGVMAALSAVDSGMGGTLPGAANAGSLAEIKPIVAMGNATAATFAFRVHVDRLERKATGLGRADVVLSASADCERCPVADAQYAFPDGPGDETLTVTLVRGVTGGRTANLRLATLDDAVVACDDFCAAPAGTAKTASHARLTRIDVTLWGVGQPSAPDIEQPAAGGPVPSSTTVAGRAEPGMPIQIRDGGHVLAQIETDAAGRWSTQVALSAGSHALSAVADGPMGTATSATRTLTVRP